MKLRALMVAVLLVVDVPFAWAQDPVADLQALRRQIDTKLQAGQRSAEDLAADLTAFDALVEKYKDQKTEDVANISYLRAMLYVQVLGDYEKGGKLLKQLAEDFPGTKQARGAEAFLARLEQRAAADRQKAALVGKPAPELHFSWANQDGLKTLSQLKGKVVILDFWATWCGPCISSFPNIREVTAHYKGADVVVVGVTSLQGRVVNLEPQPIDTKGNPEKEKALMNDFIKAKEITWTVAFSEEPVFNTDYGVSGIPHMTIIAPDGTVRYNGIHPGADSLEKKTEMIDALLKEFKLPLPGAKS